MSTEPIIDLRSRLDSPGPLEEHVERLARRKVKAVQLDSVAFIEQYVTLLDPIKAARAVLTQHAANDPTLSRILQDARLDLTGECEMLASRLMGDPATIQALNAKLEHVILHTRQTTATWVLQQGRRVYEKCVQDAMVKDRNGDPVHGKFEPLAALRALELIGKHVDVKAFKEIIEVQGDKNLLSVLESARKRVEGRVIEHPDQDEIEDAEIIRGASVPEIKQLPHATLTHEGDTLEDLLD